MLEHQAHLTRKRPKWTELAKVKDHKFLKLVRTENTRTCYAQLLNWNQGKGPEHQAHLKHPKTKRV